ncbi:MAG: hypothetical protein R8N23_01420 [Reichenbachiella sp.]|uniref:hypothetical protein n=1 Tax=Reichenbachiella sp. TaxID=2184521 RepID=UPI0029673E7C|nr:hypothetical protein [Reichenbachiella sp.]MDW3208497.1 hypothetical protein [Reichenbachiella sp.]
MEIAETLTKLQERNLKLNKFLDQTGRDYEHAGQNVPKFKKFIEEHGLDSFLIIDLVTNLQLLNNPDFDFRLDDLAKVLKSYNDLNSSDLDGYLEYGHFQNAVMDDSVTALLTVEKGIEIANKKLEELKRLKNSITTE